MSSKIVEGSGCGCVGSGPAHDSLYKTLCGIVKILNDADLTAIDVNNVGAKELAGAIRDSIPVPQNDLQIDLSEVAHRTVCVNLAEAFNKCFGDNLIDTSDPVKICKDVFTWCATMKNNTSAGLLGSIAIIEATIKDLDMKDHEDLAKDLKSASKALNNLVKQSKEPLVDENELAELGSKKFGNRIDDMLKMLANVADLLSETYVESAGVENAITTSKKTGGRDFSQSYMKKYTRGPKSKGRGYEGFGRDGASGGELKSEIVDDDDISKIDSRVKKIKKEKTDMLRKYAVTISKLLSEFTNGIKKINTELDSNKVTADKLAEFKMALDAIAGSGDKNLYVRLFMLDLVRKKNTPAQQSEKSLLISDMRKVASVSRRISKDGGFEMVASNMDDIVKTIESYTELLNKKFGSGVAGGAPDLGKASYLQFNRKELDYEISKLEQFFFVAQTQKSFKDAAKEMEAYSESYDKTLGASFANILEESSKEHKKKMEAFAKLDDDMFIDEDEREKIGQFLKNEFVVKDNFYKVVQSVDLYLKNFTKEIALAPQELKEVKQLLDGSQSISKWYDDGLTDQFAKIIDADGGTPKTLEQLNDNVVMLFKNFTAIGSIMNAFVRIGNKLGGKELSDKMKISPSNCLVHLMNFLRYSAITIRHDESANTIRAEFNENFKGEFENEYQYFLLMLKSMIAKIMMVVDASEMAINPKAPVEHIRQMRMVIGGSKNGRGDALYKKAGFDNAVIGFAGDVKIYPEAAELYYRLPLFACYYNEFFNKVSTEETADGRRIGMIPEIDGQFAGIIKFIMADNYDKTYKEITENDFKLKQLIETVNTVYAHYKDSNDLIDIQLVANDFKNEVNRRFGLVRSSDMKKYRTLTAKVDAAASFDGIKTADLFEEDSLLDSDLLLSDSVTRDSTALPSDRYFFNGSTNAELNKSNAEMMSSYERLVALFKNQLDIDFDMKGNKNLKRSYLFKDIEQKLQMNANRSDKQFGYLSKFIRESDTGSDIITSDLLMFHETVIFSTTMMRLLIDALDGEVLRKIEAARLGAPAAGAPAGAAVNVAEFRDVVKAKFMNTDPNAGAAGAIANFPAGATLADYGEKIRTYLHGNFAKDRFTGNYQVKHLLQLQQLLEIRSTTQGMAIDTSNYQSLLESLLADCEFYMGQFRDHGKIDERILKKYENNNGIFSIDYLKREITELFAKYNINGQDSPSFIGERLKWLQKKPAREDIIHQLCYRSAKEFNNLLDSAISASSVTGTGKFYGAIFESFINGPAASIFSNMQDKLDLDNNDSAKASQFPNVFTDNKMFKNISKSLLGKSYQYKMIDGVSVQLLAVLNSRINTQFTPSPAGALAAENPYVYQTLSQVPQNQREQYKANFPMIIKRLNAFMEHCDLIREMLANSVKSLHNANAVGELEGTVNYIGPSTQYIGDLRTSDNKDKAFLAAFGSTANYENLARGSSTSSEADARIANADMIAKNALAAIKAAMLETVFNDDTRVARKTLFKYVVGTFIMNGKPGLDSVLRRMDFSRDNDIAKRAVSHFRLSELAGSMPKDPASADDIVKAMQDITPAGLAIKDYKAATQEELTVERVYYALNTYVQNVLPAAERGAATIALFTGGLSNNASNELVAKLLVAGNNYNEGYSKLEVNIQALAKDQFGFTNPNDDVYDEQAKAVLAWAGSDDNVSVLNEIINRYQTLAHSLEANLTSTLESLDDRPKYGETSEDSITRFTERTGHEPFTLLSNALFLALAKSDEDEVSKTSDLNFAVKYSMRAAVYKNGKASMDEFPGVKRIVADYNASHGGKYEMNPKKFEAFMSNSLLAVRLIGRTGTGIAPLYEDNSVFVIGKDARNVVVSLDNTDNTKMLESMRDRIYKASGNAPDVVSHDNLLMSNIVELNIMPLNVNALMRSIPMTNLFNYSSLFDQIFYNPGVPNQNITADTLKAVNLNNRDAVTDKSLRQVILMINDMRENLKIVFDDKIKMLNETSLMLIPENKKREEPKKTFNWNLKQIASTYTSASHPFGVSVRDAMIAFTLKEWMKQSTRLPPIISRINKEFMNKGVVAKHAGITPVISDDTVGVQGVLNILTRYIGNSNLLGVNYDPALINHLGADIAAVKAAATVNTAPFDDAPYDGGIATDLDFRGATDVREYTMAAGARDSLKYRVSIIPIEYYKKDLQFNIDRLEKYAKLLDKARMVSLTPVGHDSYTYTEANATEAAIEIKSGLYRNIMREIVIARKGAGAANTQNVKLEEPNLQTIATNHHVSLEFVSEINDSTGGKNTIAELRAVMVSKYNIPANTVIGFTIDAFINIGVNNQVTDYNNAIKGNTEVVAGNYTVDNVDNVDITRLALNTRSMVPNSEMIVINGELAKSFSKLSYGSFKGLNVPTKEGAANDYFIVTDPDQAKELARIYNEFSYARRAVRILELFKDLSTAHHEYFALALSYHYGVVFPDVCDYVNYRVARDAFNKVTVV